jgi:5-(carboxyamino)imidazole ribonucleotide synthase
MLAPGAVIGILGGGQLGRMTALAAARLGYRTHIYSTEADSPGTQVTPLTTIAALDDGEALARFAGAVDVVTYETENIPVAALDRILPLAPVRPGPDVLRIAQDRLAEKQYLQSIDVATAPYHPIGAAVELAPGLAALGGRAVLKTVRMGYDGKGQSMIGADTDLVAAWDRLRADQAILEGFVDFRCEISVVLARGADGAMAVYPPVENRHVDHILQMTIAPAAIAPGLARTAEAIACRIGEALGVVGLLAVEMFVTRDDCILVNELAPRPHNSGHWTIDACATSQFEQLVRALAGLPLGSTEAHADAVMTNLIGPDVESWRELVADPWVRLHLYGKREAPPGRKMGHVTRLLPRTALG